MKEKVTVMLHSIGKMFWVDHEFGQEIMILYQDLIGKGLRLYV